MFCLQCGLAVHAKPGMHLEKIDLEETTDPLLQKAITESLQRPVHFRLPVSQAKSVPVTKAFTSMRAVLEAPQSVVAAAGGVAGLNSTATALPLADKDAKHEPKAGLSGLSVGWWGASRAWLAGLVMFGGFLAINLAIHSAYAGRVYPGVRVGAVAIGGVRESELVSKLRSSAPQPSLSIHIGAARYDERGAALGQADAARAAREAMTIGHDTPLPIAGLLKSWLSGPVLWKYSVDDTAVNKLTRDLAGSVAASPSVAVPVVYGGQAFMIAEKSGTSLDVDKSASKITSAIGKTSSVSLSLDKIDPLVTASSYSDDLQAAQNTLSLSLQITVKSATYKVTPQQIGSWLVFRGPGKGVAVDAAGVGTYVGTIAGSFDRAAATNALIGAVQARRDLVYVASTRKITAIPNSISIKTSPLATYKYCVRADTTEGTTQLAAKADSALSGLQGWQLGGSLKFVRADSGCNFFLSLASAADMAKTNPSCAGKASCLSMGSLVFNTESWQSPPKGWSGGAAAYRGELIDHEVGHWLGFDHAPCTYSSASKPLMSTPTVVLGGCSPNWYLVPAESLGAKEWSAL
jgi:hypothetical protein